MPAGRPPIYNLDDEAKAIEEWSKKDDATALCQFCDERDILPSYIYEWRDKSENFSVSLKKAQNRIAARMRQMLHDKKKPYNYGLFMAELGFHDRFYHDYQEELKDKDAKRKKDIEGAKQSTYNIMVPNDLAIGSNVSTASVSNQPDKGAK